ncbi:MAG: heme-binding protein [Deltaproteobacteria bacterium]|nr:heme-binding protein [Deltaproteobacteria bacterium]
MAVIAVALFISACSVFGGKAAKEPGYRVLLEDSGIEIREYETYAVAWTTAPGSFDEAVETGFQRLFEYITGGNVGATDIDMTATVLTEPETLKAAAIVAEPERRNDDSGPTALAGPSIGGWSISFVLPAGYTAETAPVPKSADVSIGDVAARCVASIRFSGALGEEAGEVERQSLERWLGARDLEHAGDWQIAGYNSPWTIPMLRRNEVLVGLRSYP